MYLPRFIFLLLLPLRFFLPSYFNFLISSQLPSFSPFLFRFDFSSGSVTFFSSPFPSLVSRQGDQIYHGNSSSKRSNQRWKKKRNRKVFLSEHSSKIPTPRKRGLIRCGNWPDIIYQSNSGRGWKKFQWRTGGKKVVTWRVNCEALNCRGGDGISRYF